MEPFRTLTAVAAPLAMENVNTDQIIPARFLRKPRSAGYGNFLFNDIRVLEGGGQNPDFVLNRAPYQPARILVALRNFGCGSDRQGAGYGPHDRRFRPVLPPTFGDIFFHNFDKDRRGPARRPPAP